MEGRCWEPAFSLFEWDDARGGRCWNDLRGDGSEPETSVGTDDVYLNIQMLVYIQNVHMECVLEMHRLYLTIYYIDQFVIYVDIIYRYVSRYVLGYT